MDSQVVTIDQFVTTMASIQEAIISLVPQPTPFILQSQTEVAPPPTMVVVSTSEDAHAHIDRLEQTMRQLRVSDGGMVWGDFDGLPVASLPAKLYSTVMRAYYLDEAQMIMLFPMSLNVPRRELEALRYRPDKTITSFISHWRKKIAQIIDKSFEKDKISMIMRSLHPRFARHLMGFPHVDFGSLVQALYGIEEGIARGLRPKSSPLDSKGKKPSYWTEIRERVYYPSSRHVQYRSPVPSRPISPTYLHQAPQPVYATQTTQRPPAHYSQPRTPPLGTPLSKAFQKLVKGGLLTTLAPRPPPQPMPPQFKLDLHYAYHQDQGLVNLGQPSVTINPLPTHTTHSMSPPTSGIHHMDFVHDDVIHMLSWDDGLPEMIVLDNGYEIVGIPSYFFIYTPFSLIPSRAPIQLISSTPSNTRHGDTFAPFILRIEDADVQVMTRSGKIAQVALPVTRPFGGTDSREEVRRQDDEMLRQQQSTQARISI
ncbi:hypothetical protein AAG906_019401 [Vitis piasezkii]